MYDISIFPKRNGAGLMQEAEIMFFNEEFLKSMVPLIDTTVGLSLREFFRKFDEMPKKPGMLNDSLVHHVEMMKEILGERIRTVTVPYDLKQNGSWSKLVTRFPRLSELSVEERNDSLKDIDYILDNINILIDTIPPRNKQDYKKFIAMCKAVETNRDNYLHRFGQHLEHINKTDDFVAYVMNSGLFYKPQEKPYNTGAKIFMRQATLLKRFKHGIEFVDKSREAKIPASSFRIVEF